MPTPGILYAAGRITSPDLTPAAFTEWYNTVHIREVLSIPSGPPRAYRFENTATTTDAPTHPPYLALYPVDDLSIVSSPHFAALSDTHPLLPHGASYLSLTAFDVRVYATVETYTKDTAASAPTPTPTHALTLALAPSSSTSPTQLTAWTRAAHRALADRVPGYVRCTRYSLVAAPLANARPRGEGEAVPSELLVCEFAGEGVPSVQELEKIVRAAEGGEAVVGGAGILEQDLWGLVFEGRKEDVDGEGGKA
ncbi:uncharacterized protein K452DRAFT_320112 [Aplosporella prunicola CBS 121167]|uniref:EthD domain-containing protein n=1 Tax=Aplosporella prunicola CBS 121167 TaxID=1176127 RepID=A0A6A6B7K9_9PEZI|nr:uncharacterized protein K452DRAFT_320112 [Aplosporella prunicola CBS 121167]KAF2140040.1 hypothetical protein K452DRAFT_320112 [Aplosporella prunicola CBS 121167]